MDGAPQDWVLHVDLDQFVAAVEIARRPELRGLPVVVGGDGDPRRPRQVVATASYEARAFGVRSGLPLELALRRCPQAVFLPVDHDACTDASERVMAVLRTFPAVVEVAGWDEAFLAVTTDDPVTFAVAVRAAVAERAQLSCAVGIGGTKQRAKIAVAAAKPGGINVITAAEWPLLMGERPVDALWGIGQGWARRLTGAGLATVAEGHSVARVAVTVRTATFFTRTRTTTLPAPSRDPADVQRAALVVLARFPLDRPVRLVGVRVEFAG